MEIETELPKLDIEYEIKKRIIWVGYLEKLKVEEIKDINKKLKNRGWGRPYGYKQKSGRNRRLIPHERIGSRLQNQQQRGYS